MAIIAFQMRVRNIGSTSYKNRWGERIYQNYFEATNPYTGKLYKGWDDDAAWVEHEDDEEEEEIDEYAPLRKEEYDYWCNGWNGRCIP